MMRFYGMTDRDVFMMPFPRLLTLYHQIDRLEAEEDMRLLVTYHTGDPKERLEVLERHAHGRARTGQTTEQLMESPATKLIASYVEGDAIREEHERMRRADEERRRAWEARNAVQPPGVLPPSAPEEPEVGVSGEAV